MTDEQRQAGTRGGTPEAGPSPPAHKVGQFITVEYSDPSSSQRDSPRAGEGKDHSSEERQDGRGGSNSIDSAVADDEEGDGSGDGDDEEDEEEDEDDKETTRNELGLANDSPTVLPTLSGFLSPSCFPLCKPGARQPGPDSVVQGTARADWRQTLCVCGLFFSLCGEWLYSLCHNKTVLCLKVCFLRYRAILCDRYCSFCEYGFCF